MTTATKDLYTLMSERKSVRKYDPTFKMTQAELEEILALATSAPSSSNLQSWRFIVFQDEATKKELRAIANDQEQVETASAVIAVIGDSDMYKNVEKIAAQNVAEGHMDENQKNTMINNAMNLYPYAPAELRRNIASFDAGLISMQIMLIAKEKGYDTVPMAGFDMAKFAERFELPEHHHPIALIAIGKAVAPAYGTSRMPVKDIARFI
ncbi:nitroreductase family protein [Bhargavaea beijingensis]|uniref:Nitroreductase family protein n=1 Tax=Bhargavaea beijingensis TaxID=426756 RepID=A0A1G7E5S4_9BACL|nr:nitroreductase family protein [Bhargavaea beijingensis]MCW1927512.1 nitroreductase family protein [Bhargavaea beijingensis]RSK34931.1 nitroreductase family protein [Bhargavaea beijingensis]SDE58796.1 hypothetical protein SAMN04488126_11270 [Bhargavaea beijingensis]